MRILIPKLFSEPCSAWLDQSTGHNQSLSLPSVTHTQEERELLSFPGISERPVANGQGWNPTQPAPRVLCPSFCDTSGAPPESQASVGVSFRSTILFPRSVALCFVCRESFVWRPGEWLGTIHLGD